MRQIASDEPARHVPSTGECARCVLTADDCSERIEAESHSPGYNRIDGLPTSRQAGARGMPGYGLDGPCGDEGVRYRAFGYPWGGLARKQGLYGLPVSWFWSAIVTSLR